MESQYFDYVIIYTSILHVLLILGVVAVESPKLMYFLVFDKIFKVIFQRQSVRTGVSRRIQSPECFNHSIV